MKTLSIVVCYLIVVSIVFGIYKWIIKWRDDRWLSSWRKGFPLTFQEYISVNPSVKTGNGIKCISCGSRSLKNWGINGPHSDKRSVTCNHCSSRLYRVEN